MTSPPHLLDETLQAWTYARDGVIAEFQNIPADRFGFKPTPKSRSVAELAQHIVESGLVAAGELSRPDGDFTRQPYPAFLREYSSNRASSAGKEQLLTVLRETHDEALEKLRVAGEPLILAPIRQFNGTPATRLTWLNHAIAHEEYHRGQVALYARVMGIVPALTRLIEGS